MHAYGGLMDSILRSSVWQMRDSSWTCETFRSRGLFFCTVDTFSLVLWNQPKMTRQSILSNVAETLGRESIWQILVGGIVNWNPVEFMWFRLWFVECQTESWSTVQQGWTLYRHLGHLWTIVAGRMTLAMPSWWMRCRCERPGRALLAKPTDEHF